MHDKQFLPIGWKYKGLFDLFSLLNNFFSKYIMSLNYVSDTLKPFPYLILGNSSN